MIQFNPVKHVLLRDIAHRRRIHEDEEFEVFLDKVEATGIAMHEVVIPDWPPVPRTPLQVLFSVGGEGKAPFEDKPWTGTQLVIKSNFWDENRVFKIAKEMAPDTFEPKRLAYQWECSEFDPLKHVVIRHWCHEHGINIVEFWKEFFKSTDDLEYILTTNPEVKAERASGSYSPTRKCLLVSDMHIPKKYFLGIDVEPVPHKENEENVVPVMREVHDSDEDEGVDMWKMTDDIKIYDNNDVISALELALNREARLFGGQTSDSNIVAISEKSLTRFLSSDPLDKEIYVKDTGGRNYDCENFSESLRSAMQLQYGINGMGVIWGNQHAFNFCVVVGEECPKIIFIEPQTDAIITELAGQYSVEKRCEVLL